MLFASLCIPIAFLAARKFFASEAMGLGVAALMVCMPELMIDVSRTGNESLAIPLYSMLTLLLLRAVEPGASRLLWAAGVVLGLGLLTKAYFAFALPALLLPAAYFSGRPLPGESKRAILHGSQGIALALLISFGWYLRTRLLTGAWSGEGSEVTAAHAGLGHLMTAFRHVNWIGGITSVLVSHVWFGGWSFLKLPKPVYVLFAFGMAAAAYGVVKLLIQDRPWPRQLLVVVVLYGLFWVGLLYHVFVTFVATGVSASTGWYMYAVIVPELLLLTCGLFAVTPRSWHRWVLPTVTVAFAAIDVYSVHALLVPYYTGVIAHVAGSRTVSPATWPQLATAGPHLILTRLSVNKPSFLEPGTLVLLFLLYYLSTAIVVTVALISARQKADAL
jgi:4-amino-4-deoxy-L-arabinose transferase-like glycosyltransferase